MYLLRTQWVVRANLWRSHLFSHLLLRVQWISFLAADSY
uniref:Uncharacterized protein n=1 Tax=Anguilla anguilla TaxID=7936 RepID=A0A0E9WFA7_ANGAN